MGNLLTRIMTELGFFTEFDPMAKVKITMSHGAYLAWMKRNQEKYGYDLMQWPYSVRQKFHIIKIDKEIPQEPRQEALDLGL